MRKINDSKGNLLCIVYKDEDWVEGLNFITDNSLFISSHDMDQLGTFSIYDLSGRAVLRQVDVDSESKISVRLLENGAYILKSDNYNFTLKFVK